MLNVLRTDYVRTAQAKGLATPVVVLKHALRNAALPIVTIVGIEFGTLLGGTVMGADASDSVTTRISSHLAPIPPLRRLV